MAKKYYDVTTMATIFYSLPMVAESEAEAINKAKEIPMKDWNWAVDFDNMSDIEATPE